MIRLVCMYSRHVHIQLEIATRLPTSHFGHVERVVMNAPGTRVRRWKKIGLLTYLNSPVLLLRTKSNLFGDHKHDRVRFRGSGSESGHGWLRSNKQERRRQRLSGTKRKRQAVRMRYACNYLER